MLPSSGAQTLRQWEEAVEEAAADLQNTEEQLHQATQYLLALQARCAEAATELRSQESEAQGCCFSTIAWLMHVDL